MSEVTREAEQAPCDGSSLTDTERLSLLASQLLDLEGPRQKLDGISAVLYFLPSSELLDAVDKRMLCHLYDTLNDAIDELDRQWDRMLAIARKESEQADA